MLLKKATKVFLYSCGLATASLVLLFAALASGSASDLQRAAEASVDAERVVSFFFSTAAWGGVPFSKADKQTVMVDAMLSGELVRLETDVVHLLSAPEARVRSFMAVFEVDGSVRPPTMRAGYELELLVPRSREALTVELINADTGVVNLLEVEPESQLALPR